MIYAAICSLCQQDKLNPSSSVRFPNLSKQHPGLHTINTHPITHVQVTTNPEDLKVFFDEYQKILNKYHIKCAKYIHNMDESGVRIGCPTGETVIDTAKVKEQYTTSSENRQSHTMMETICADGTPPPPPVVICPGEQIMENLITDNLTCAEAIAVSQTGYTTGNIALSWLDHFINLVDARPNKHWHVLLLDGHITYR